MKPPCNDILIGLHLNCAQGHICHSQWILIVINWSSTADQSLYFTHTAQHSNTISCARWWILSWISYHATKILVYIITFYIIIFLYFIGCFTVKKLQLFCFISFFFPQHLVSRKKEHFACGSWHWNGCKVDLVAVVRAKMCSSVMKNVCYFLLYQWIYEGLKILGEKIKGQLMPVYFKGL